jgi:2-polyprenyl-6-methoxyphenol hydroxylase-like FAD-dependent oxidoreductase
MNSHAVILGAGMAGLMAAGVLSEFYDMVTVLEGDALPDRAVQRKGVPQGRHLHNFLARGTQILDELFPGILDELAATGAVVDDRDDLSGVHVRMGRYVLNPSGRLTDPRPLVAYQASRPFMESHVRRRVAALGNVTIVDNHEAVEPVITGDTVTGVRIINRATGTGSVMPSRLVVDATGRGSRTPHFLEGHGFGAVPVQQIPSAWGYSSQLLHLPAGSISERMVFINEGNAAAGALLLAYEHNTWMLAIAQPAECGSPPADFAAMMDMAENLLPPTIAAALRGGIPVGAFSVARSTAATWRRYDRNSRHPEGLIIAGDALCSLNPLHGQGMTVAALQALALRDCLQAGQTNLPERFYRAAAQHIAPVWAMNRAADTAPSPETARTIGHRIMNWTQRAVARAASRDMAVTEPILRVRGLIDPPARLRDPSLFGKVLLANIRGPQRNTDQGSHQCFSKDERFGVSSARRRSVNE